jgi:hypothetical protein
VERRGLWAERRDWTRNPSHPGCALHHGAETACNTSHRPPVKVRTTPRQVGLGQSGLHPSGIVDDRIVKLWKEAKHVERPRLREWLRKRQRSYVKVQALVWAIDSMINNFVQCFQNLPDDPPGSPPLCKCCKGAFVFPYP